MRPLSLVSIVSPVVFALVACAGSTTENTSSSEGNLAERADDADTALARKSVAIIAGSNGRCNTCHTAGKDEIVRWGTSLKAIDDSCLSGTLTLSAAQRIACLQGKGTESGVSATRLGLYSAGATLPEFENLFKSAYAEGEWREKYAEFKMQAAMPAGGGVGMTAAEFATVKQWALAGMPRLDAILEEPGAFPCTPKSSPELQAHLDEMKTSGWGARLAEASTPMAGCGGEASALGCLTRLADITTTIGYPGTRQTLRELRKLSFRTSYWARSSPDGRFAAFGGSPSRIIDLNAPETDAPITVQAPYDPGFFPNNDGFSYAGTQAGGLRVCRTSVLLNALSSPTRTITFSEPGCTRIIDTVYQSVGAALDGSLFFMATGAHTNDPGSSTGPVSASFGENALTTLTPMFNDGTKYVPGAAVQVKIPFEGDQQMSPSNQLLVTRFGQKAGFSGYRIRKVTPTFGATSTGGVSSVTVRMKELGTVCLAGGKPQLSFDERFLAVHQYTDTSANPEGLPSISANIFVNDLRTGKTVQVTKLGQNQRALFPHWRADGWLYFLVRDASSGQETLVATDVALRTAS